MKQQATSILISLANAMAMSASANASNVIRFNGEVTDQTCSAVINGGTDPTIVLNNVPVSDLYGAWRRQPCSLGRFEIEFSSIYMTRH